MGNIRKAEEIGQSIWFDNIERNMLGSKGKLAQMIVKEGLLLLTLRFLKKQLPAA